MKNTPLNILVIEDNPGDFLLVREYLEEMFARAEIIHADALQNGVEIIKEQAIDVVLLDLTLPDGMGIGSYKQIESAAPKVPVIILTGFEDTETALESLKIGAQDYIVKDECNALLLSKAIKYAIERKKHEGEKELLIEELMQHNTDLQQFSYITSHNLRAPLSNLLGILKLLDFSSVTDPLTLELLKNFEECTLQLNDTVNDLINILIVKNAVNAQKESIDLRKVFDKVVHSIHNAVDQNNVRICKQLDDAYEVDFNRTYLESILLNLLTNAIKYRSPKRSPEIKIWTEKTSDGVKLHFADNGLGIDLKRYKDRIFGLYQRFHNHADSKGLGLYIVNSQVKAMGGEINVESEVDKGTTFIITFKSTPHD